MHREEERLMTFREWPSSGVTVSPEHMARAGFYSTGQGMEVQCFSCGGRISHWEYGDQAMGRHRLLSPTCPFVLSPPTSGNIPLLPSTAPPPPPPAAPTASSPTEEEEHVTKDSIYKIDVLRLISFTDWPVKHISRESLALAGFYYVRGNGDRVRCAWCGGELQNWAPGDVPLAEHLRHFPHCSYANTKANASTINNDSVLEGNAARELGIRGVGASGGGGIRSLEARQRSFTPNWPQHLQQRPADLAAAGFYYVGPQDQVRCFECSGSLRQWEVGDDPWEEHARWFPTCSFLALAKGETFIRNCRLNSEVGGTRAVRLEEEVERCMGDSHALAALACGLQPQRIRNAIKARLQDTGTPFLSTDALIDAALNEQLNETPFIPSSPNLTPEHSDPPTRPRRSPRIVSEATGGRVSADIVSGEVEGVGVGAIEGEEGTPSPPLTLEEENRLLKEARLCKVCMDAEVGVVFLPCGHLLSCVQCAPCLPACPLCRSKVKGVVRTYLS